MYGTYWNVPLQKLQGELGRVSLQVRILLGLKKSLDEILRKIYL